MGRDVRAILCVALLVPASVQAVDTDPRSVREVPARSIPVPTTVSPQMAKFDRAAAATGPRAPQSVQEWQAVIRAAAAEDLARITELKKQFAVTVEAIRLGGVPCYQ